MIRVVMFDLGLTLIDSNNRPFPHVKEALTALSTFTSTSGKPLLSCLVSDFTMPTPPSTAAKINTIFKDYLTVLEGTGLRPFFEPTKKRVTLSTHAGALKPERKIFEAALQRLGTKTGLEDCLLVTENSTHIRSVREKLGMQTLQFQPPAGRPGFNDWAQAPGLIANLVAPHQFSNAQAAVKAHLAAHGIELDSAEPSSKPGAMKIAAKSWHAISVPEFDELRDVLVSVPVEGEITRGPEGKVESVNLRKPSPEDIDEVTSFVRSLATHGQIEGHSKGPSRGATHAIETDEKGNRKLVRKRFTAV
jgi:hypothetical protein